MQGDVDTAGEWCSIVDLAITALDSAASLSNQAASLLTVMLSNKVLNAEAALAAYQTLCSVQYSVLERTVSNKLFASSAASAADASNTTAAWPASIAGNASGLTGSDGEEYVIVDLATYSFFQSVTSPRTPFSSRASATRRLLEAVPATPARQKAAERALRQAPPDDQTPQLGTRAFGSPQHRVIGLSNQVRRLRTLQLCTPSHRRSIASITRELTGPVAGLWRASAAPNSRHCAARLLLHVRQPHPAMHALTRLLRGSRGGDVQGGRVWP